MTYNVHNFNGTDKPGHLPAHKKILKLINSYQPDIIGFQEFNSKNVIFRICDSLKRTMRTNQFYFEPFMKTKWDSTGLALFSKYPITNHGIIRLSNNRDGNQVIYIDVKCKSQIIRVYTFHLQSLKLNEDDLDLSSFLRRSISKPHTVKELFHKLKMGFTLREQQVDIIRQDAAKCPYPYIFMGDFNDTPGSYAFNQMATGMKNAFREKGTGIGKTFNGGFASSQIDYILLSQQFSVLDYQIIRKEISDHYPVLSDVMLTR
ncbi:MAG TPA: endonuclease/exonuclease/phosphatase family protein [Mucilaginibacter sp.]|jgi:endonuclease/exonuclease/phosphatase family metal-dependent hydrolase